MYMFMDTLPSLCFTSIQQLADDVENCKEYTQTIPLLDLITPHSVASLIYPFIGTDLAPYFFTKLRAQLNINAKEAGLVWPDKYRGTIKEIVFAYLHNTPFLDLIQNTSVPFIIPRSRYQEHGALFAKTGHGKTQTLRTIIHGFLQEDDPPAMFIMDSLGSLIEDIDKLEIFNTRLRDRLVIIDPKDTPALNFFQLQSEDLQFYLFKAIDQTFTPRQATMIAYLMELMRHAPHPRIEDLIAVCEGRLHFPEVLDKLSPIARSFMESQFYAKKPDPLVQQTKQQIAQRLYTLGRNPKFNEMFSATTNEFDAFKFMQEKKIVLIKTDARASRLGGLGQEGSSVLGRFILAQCLDAARARPPRERHLALIICDEAKAYMDDQTALILSDARQFGLGMLLATQFPHQLEEGVRREINTNTSIKLMGPVEYAVASQYSRDMFTSPEFIMGMRSRPPESAEWACYVSNLTPHAVKLTVPFLALEKEPRMSDADHHRLRERNRERYGAQLPVSTVIEPSIPPATTRHKKREVDKVAQRATRQNRVEQRRTTSVDDDFDTDR